MPKGSTSESSKEPYHKMELNTRMYISGGATGPVFAVVSLSGIKSNPALYTEMQRINSYVDAFKTFFPPKVRKEPIVKLALVGNKTLRATPVANIVCPSATSAGRRRSSPPANVSIRSST